jgi:hypothetical protein
VSVIAIAAAGGWHFTLMNHGGDLLLTTRPEMDVRKKTKHHIESVCKFVNKQALAAASIFLSIGLIAESIMYWKAALSRASAGTLPTESCSDNRPLRRPEWPSLYAGTFFY